MKTQSKTIPPGYDPPITTPVLALFTTFENPSGRSFPRLPSVKGTAKHIKEHLQDRVNLLSKRQRNQQIHLELIKGL